MQEKRLQEMERSLQETDEALTTQQKRLSELEHAISEGAENGAAFAKAATTRRLWKRRRHFCPKNRQKQQG